MKAVLERQKCIGCGTCQAVCPKFFELAEDGKSHLKCSKFNEKDEKEELEISQAGCVKEAVQSCPAECIFLLN